MNLFTMLRNALIFTTLLTFTANTFANFTLLGIGAASIDKNKELIVGDPVYMRNGIIELTYYLRVKDGQYDTLTRSTKNQYGKTIRTHKIQYNSFQKSMTVNCNTMMAIWKSDSWWDNDKRVFYSGTNAKSQQLMRQNGFATNQIALEPNSDAHTAAAYQCEHSLQLKQYG